jgi:hypothetical protein
LDGEIGRVKSFYFDVQNWAAPYLVAETGTWLASRQVLIPPQAVRGGRSVDNVFTVNLTRRQIEDSPALEWHKPVSRKYEEDYHQYYGWPYYWECDSSWPGIRLFGNEPPDGHLRRTQEVNGYDVQTSRGTIGRVCDFMFNDHSWPIDHVVVKADRRWTESEFQIPTKNVNRISYLDSAVFVHWAKETVGQTPKLHLAEQSTRVGAC